MTTPVTLLGRALPSSVQRTVHLIEQGETLACRSEWRYALAVVEHGEIEIRAASGARVRFEEGASFNLHTPATLLIMNPGPGRAVVATVALRIPRTTSTI